MNLAQLLGPQHFMHVPILHGIDIASRYNEIGATIRHFHETIQLTLILSGTGHFHGTRSCIDVTQGSLVVIPPGEAHHTIVQSARWSFVTLHIPLSLVAPVSLERATKIEYSQLLLTQCRDSELNTQFQELIVTIVDQASLSMAHSLLCTFWDNLQSILTYVDYDYTEDIPLAIRQACAYLHDNIADTISLHKLADRVGISVSYLAHAFHRFYGLPPHAYQRQLRLQRARQLLAHQQPIADVAAVTGFADQSHLTRHFRRLTGITPGMYVANSKHVQDTSS